MEGEEGLEEYNKKTMDPWKKRRKELGPSQIRCIVIVPLQDDWTCYAVGRRAAAKARVNIRKILEEQYKMLINKKEEANRTPYTKFKSIGVVYTNLDTTCITLRPSKDVLSKLNRVINEVSAAVGKLTRKRFEQEWAGVSKFVAGFVQDGRNFVKALCSILAASKLMNGTKVD